MWDDIIVYYYYSTLPSLQYLNASVRFLRSSRDYQKKQMCWPDTLHTLKHWIATEILTQSGLLRIRRLPRNLSADVKSEWKSGGGTLAECSNRRWIEVITVTLLVVFCFFCLRCNFGSVGCIALLLLSVVAIAVLVAVAAAASFLAR